jgi:hypothetical protein
MMQSLTPNVRIAISTALSAAFCVAFNKTEGEGLGDFASKQTFVQRSM